MSYGFYKLPPRSSHEDYIVKVAGKTPIAIGFDMASVDITVEHTVEIRTDRVKAEAIVVEIQAIDFRAQGYSGDICTHCSGARLRWAGHCQVCDDCGQTTGCS